MALPETIIVNSLLILAVVVYSGVQVYNAKQSGTLMNAIKSQKIWSAVFLCSLIFACWFVYQISTGKLTEHFNSDKNITNSYSNLYPKNSNVSIKRKVERYEGDSYAVIDYEDDSLPIRMEGEDTDPVWFKGNELKRNEFDPDPMQWKKDQELKNQKQQLEIELAKKKAEQEQLKEQKNSIKEDDSLTKQEQEEAKKVMEQEQKRKLLEEQELKQKIEQARAQQIKEEKEQQELKEKELQQQLEQQKLVQNIINDITNKDEKVLQNVPVETVQPVKKEAFGQRYRW